MRYVRIFADEDGKSAFEDVEVDGTPTVTVEGVPPLLVSGPFPASSMLVVEQPAGGTPEWQPHVAPRKQWLVVLSGRAVVTVSDGERREFGPGSLLSFEDTEGEGHMSTPLTDDLSFAMFPHQAG
jgi:quercetin dioxygenase-like cupin family protein